MEARGLHSPCASGSWPARGLPHKALCGMSGRTSCFQGQVSEWINFLLRDNHFHICVSSHTWLKQIPGTFEGAYTSYLPLPSFTCEPILGPWRELSRFWVNPQGEHKFGCFQKSQRRLPFHPHATRNWGWRSVVKRPTLRYGKSTRLEGNLLAIIRDCSLLWTLKFGLG